MKILIVDDEQSISSSLVKFFKIDDIESDAAENGFSAQRMLEYFSAVPTANK